MTVLDLVKATVVCGSLAFVTYSFPVVGQATVIAFLCLLWLLYLRTTIERLRRR
jgi:hypothetical protein